MGTWTVGRGAYWGPVASCMVSLYGLWGAVAWPGSSCSRAWVARLRAPLFPPGTRSRDSVVRETER